MKPRLTLILMFLGTVCMTFLLLWLCLGIMLGPHPTTGFEAAWKGTAMFSAIALYVFFLVGMWDKD